MSVYALSLQCRLCLWALCQLMRVFFNKFMKDAAQHSLIIVNVERKQLLTH